MAASDESCDPARPCVAACCAACCAAGRQARRQIEKGIAGSDGSIQTRYGACSLPRRLARTERGQCVLFGCKEIEHAFNFAISSEARSCFGALTMPARANDRGLSSAARSFSRQ